MDIKVRKANKEDYEHISSLLQCLHEFHVANRSDVYLNNERILSYTEYIEILKDSNKVIFVATIQNSVIGYALAKIMQIGENIVTRQEKISFIEEIVIHEEYRRNGVGVKLLNSIKQFARAKDCTSVQLNVWEFNTIALEFYKNIGFKTRNRRMEYSL